MATPDDVLTFWFGASPDAPFERAHLWWAADPAFDADVTERFASTLERAGAGELDRWGDSPRGALALVILLDQFSRHVHRDRARAFAHDTKALATAQATIERGGDAELAPVERQFLYMPLMHAEDRAVQSRSVELFGRLCRQAPSEQRQAFEQAYDHALEHAEIVARFGRFPHRNGVLGRATTPDEQAFLDERGRGF